MSKDKTIQTQGLSLNKETLRKLSSQDLDQVQGAGPDSKHCTNILSQCICSKQINGCC